MKFPNPNLLRFIRPAWLQLWCAKKGVLSDRWTYAETEAIRRAGADRYNKLKRLFDYDPYDYAEFACHLCGHELIAPWELCPGCGANMTAKDSPNVPNVGTDGLTDQERTALADEYERDMRNDE